MRSANGWKRFGGEKISAEYFKIDGIGLFVRQIPMPVASFVCETLPEEFFNGFSDIVASYSDIAF